MKMIALVFILSASLFSQSEFIKMCVHPTPSQKVTLQALVDQQRMEYGKEACEKIENRYIKNYGRSGFLEILHLGNKNITDITLLKYFTGIKELDLSDNKIKDITPIANLTQLKSLEISNNPITDINALEKLIELESLGLYKINVKNKYVLASLKALKFLSISDQTDIFETIGSLNNLETLYINRTDNLNLCDLNSLTSLKRLSMSANDISDISCLKSLKNLEYLTLQNNPIDDISVLSNYSKLSSVDLRDTSIKDIRVLKDLKKIDTVIIDDTQVKDASPLSGKYMSIFSAENTPLRWCSPKTGQEIIDGVSCFEKDGTEKSWFKRMFKL